MNISLLLEIDQFTYSSVSPKIAPKLASLAVAHGSLLVQTRHALVYSASLPSELEGYEVKAQERIRSVLGQQSEMLRRNCVLSWPHPRESDSSEL